MGTVLLMVATFMGSIAVPNVSGAPPIDGTLSSPLWQRASVAHLTYDLRTHQPASDTTTDYVMTDGTYLYVGVDAKQRIPVRAQQHTNNVGLDTDDEVQIDLWPNGTSGFQYVFIATPLGTHYQFSSENTSFEPTWYSAGRVTPGGFTVTMKIPLSVMHSSGGGTWRVQFARLIEATNNDLVWSYGSSQQNHNDVNYAGAATGLPALTAFRPKPRIGVYALGAVAAPSAGGSTSRAGVDLSIPTIPGTAFVATLHPDYSDVEQDQQTIAPTAFPRFLNEVRPFFTQGANFYNNTPNCTDCPGSQLYTPAIPTPRDGYAIEGKRGLFSYAAFDAVGVSRTDAAQVFNYASPSQHDQFTVQRVAVNYPGFADYSENLSYTHDNLKNFSAWLRYANDSGTNVLAGDRAQRYEAGVNLYTPTSSLQAELRKVGQYFNPADGLIFNPDIAGYVVNGYKAFKLSPSSWLKEVDVQADLQRYHGHTGGLDDAVTGLWTSFTTRNLFNLQLTTGSQYAVLSNGIFTPITQQGAQLTYGFGTSTPSIIGFNSGRYGSGRLNSWTRSTSLRVGPRAVFTVEADDTDQFLDDGRRYTQWLERASLAYQSGRDESVALGARRIIGFIPYLTSTPAFQNGWNLSAAFRRKVPGGELYVVYGDAASFSTVPQFIIKYIRYVGADKGA